jgi:hypothetical protein
MCVTFEEHLAFVQDGINQLNDNPPDSWDDSRLVLSDKNGLRLRPNYQSSCIHYNRRTWITSFLYAVSSRHTVPLYLDYLVAVRLLERHYYDASKAKIDLLKDKFSRVVGALPESELLKARSGLHGQCLFAVEHEITHFAFDQDSGFRDTVEASLREAILNVYAPMTTFVPIIGRKAKQGWSFVLDSPRHLEELSCDDRAFFGRLQLLAGLGASPEEIYRHCVDSYLAVYCLETINLFDDLTSMAESKDGYARGNEGYSRRAEAEAVNNRSMSSSLRTGIVGDITATHVKRRLPRGYLPRYLQAVRERASYLSTIKTITGLLGGLKENIHFEDTSPNHEEGGAVKALLEELESSMLQAMGG